jgi:hypothetical protein
MTYLPPPLPFDRLRVTEIELRLTDIRIKVTGLRLC